MLRELDNIMRMQKISVLEDIDKFAAEQGIDLGPSEQRRKRRERLRS